MRPALFALLPFVGACHGMSSNIDADQGTYNCATETRADTWQIPLEKKGELAMLDFQLVSATPAPPARGDNTWILQVNVMANGVAGAPMQGASIVATPYMPDHQHGTPKVVNITAMSTAGQYQLEPVNMWMPGLWQTTIQVTPGTTSSGGASDTVVYSICIPD
jgi:hypothetical protein